MQVIDALLCLGAVVDHKPIPAHLLLARQPAVLIVVIIFKGNFNCSFLIVASRASCALGAALLQLCCSSVAALLQLCCSSFDRRIASVVRTWR